MRVIIRYCLPWGNHSTAVIEINVDTSVNDLILKVSDRFKINSNKLILKMERDDYMVKNLNNNNFHPFILR